MNGLGRKDNGEKDKAPSIFTKETLGVVLILFATLCLVCLITRETVFSVPGQYVNYFLFGCFGWFAYAVIAFVAVMGVELLTGKKTSISTKKKALITLCFSLFVLVLHVISMRNYSSLSYGEYLAKCYSMAEQGGASASAGGFFTGLIAYLFSSILTNVGSYVVVGIGLAFALFGTIREFLNPTQNNTSTQKAEKFKSSFVKESPIEVVPNSVTIDGVKEYPVSGVDFSENSSKQKLFVNSPEDFSLRTKRDIAKDKGDTAIKFGFSDNGLGVADTVKTDLKANSTTYSDDFKSKLDYIKTPAAINVETISSNSYGGYAQSVNNYQTSQRTTVSEYVPVSKPVEEEKLEEKQDAIPHHEHEGDKLNTDDAVHHAQAFNDRYAEISEVDEEEVVAPIEEEQTFRPLANELTSSVSEERTSKIRESVFDIPMVEEFDCDTEENKGEAEEQTFNERQSDSAKEEVPPTPSILGSGRVRNIFFSEEKKEQVQSGAVSSEKPADSQPMGFTSRVSADNNLSSRRGFDFSVAKNETQKEEIIEPKPEKEKPPINREYFRPPFDLLETYTQPVNVQKDNHEERMEIIQRTLEDFHINAVPQSYVQGPSITRYEIMMPAGISVKKVLNYDDDLKMRLSARDGVRIEAPIPGKNLVGIEVANSVKVMVGLKEVMEGLVGKKSKETSLMFALGKDIVGNAISDDLTKGPHYLIAGATGSGKSVCLHVMIVSLLMRYSPEELKLVLVDPKSVEFRKYEHIPHLLVDEIITEPKRALTLLQWAYDETNRRNEMFTECGGMISNIEDYNTQIASDTIPKLPRIVFIIDELADLMESCKKDLEAGIRKIAAKARSAGIHLVLATQRPSVDVITGTIKANLPSRIALKVMNFADSQTILGEAGAEKLLGNGDMLYKNSSMGDYERYQGAYISGREVTNVVNYIKEHNKAYFDDDIMNFLDKETKAKPEENQIDHEDGESGAGELSELFLQALWLAVNTETISISQLQRRFQIGYARAGGLVDKMERMGLVSGNEGSKARRVLITKEEFESRFGAPPEEF